MHESMPPACFHMSLLRRVVGLLLILFGLLAIPSSKTSAAEAVTLGWQFYDRTLITHSGSVSFGEHATLVVPDDMVFLQPQDAEYVNRVSLGHHTEFGSILGMLVPQELRESFRRANQINKAVDDKATPDVREWAFLLTWTGVHVPVSEGLATNPDDLMSVLHEAIRRTGNRRSPIYPSKASLLPWVEPPTYERERHALIWPLLLRESAGNQRMESMTRKPIPTGQDVLNYQVRLLGARGYIQMVAVGGPADLPAIAKATHHLLGRISWSSGEDYASAHADTYPRYRQGIVGMVNGIVEEDPNAKRIDSRGRSTWRRIQGQIWILIAIGIGVSWLIAKYIRPPMAPSRIRPINDQPQNPNARCCPRCAQVLHQTARCCPACGASTPPAT